MNKQKLYKNIYTIVAVLVIAVIGFFAFIGIKSLMSEPVSDPYGYSESKIVDVIGTAAAPYRFSFAAVTAGSRYSTTTGTIFVGDDVNVLDININAIEASTTEDFNISVESSNDANCSTTTADGITAIKWVDADPGTATQESTTSTRPFGLAGGHGGKYQITNWNGLCARIGLGSASSTAWVSVSKQSLNAN